jgi:hypothetical protein
MDEKTLKILSADPDRIFVKPSREGLQVPRYAPGVGQSKLIKGPESLPYTGRHRGYYFRRIDQGDLMLCSEDEVRKARGIEETKPDKPKPKK